MSDVSHPELWAYVLAGGASRRFGSDKARATLHGRPLLLHVAQAAGSWSVDVTVVADREQKYADLGLRTIGDLQPGLGPVAGVARALLDLSARRGERGWAVVLACDVLGLNPRWIEQLWHSRRAASMAAAFRGPRWQPLPLLVSVRALAPATRALERGARALWRLLDQLPAEAVPLPADWGSAVPVNTRHQLDQLQQRRTRV